MRLKESTLADAFLVRRIRVPGALGGEAERFSDVRIALRASVLPGEGGLSVAERGCVNRERLRLLVPGDAQVRCGDGVWLNGRLWRIADVQKWTAHAELECEAIV